MEWRRLPAQTEVSCTYVVCLDLLWAAAPRLFSSLAALGTGMVQEDVSDIIKGARKEVQKASSEFKYFDANEDGELDFMEFAKWIQDQLETVVPAATMRQWFDLCDIDGDGTISQMEFAKLAWYNSVGGNEKAIQKILKKFDKDGSGQLSREEMGEAAKRLGFGDLSTQMFEMLDKDGSGVVTATEIQEFLLSSTRESQKLSMFMLAFNKNPVKVKEKPKQREWQFESRSLEAVRLEMMRIIREEDLRLIEIFRELDDNESGSLSRSEIRRWMARGMSLNDSTGGELDDLVADLISDIDSNASETGSVSFEELCEWLEYVPKRHKARKKEAPPPMVRMTPYKNRRAFQRKQLDYAPPVWRPPGRRSAWTPIGPKALRTDHDPTYLPTDVSRSRAKLLVIESFSASCTIAGTTHFSPAYRGTTSKQVLFRQPTPPLVPTAANLTPRASSSATTPRPPGSAPTGGSTPGSAASESPGVCPHGDTSGTAAAQATPPAPQATPPAPQVTPPATPPTPQAQPTPQAPPNRPRSSDAAAVASAPAGARGRQASTPRQPPPRSAPLVASPYAVPYVAGRGERGEGIISPYEHPAVRLPRPHSAHSAPQSPHAPLSARQLHRLPPSGTSHGAQSARSPPSRPNAATRQALPSESLPAPTSPRRRPTSADRPKLHVTKPCTPTPGRLLLCGGDADAASVFAGAAAWDRSVRRAPRIRSQYTTRARTHSFHPPALLAASICCACPAHVLPSTYLHCPPTR